MAVQLDVIGSSPAWPNPGGACSGYLVEGRLLLDCGPGVLAKLREREPWPTVDAIAITHLHLDHWGDLIPWVWGSLFGPGRGARPALWLPPGSREELKPILARLGNVDMLEKAFDVAEYEAGVPFTAAGLSVQAHKVIHYDIDAYGFRVEGEKTLAYSGDTGPCDALVDIARDADLFVCEATLGSGTEESDLRGHLCVSEAVAALEQSRRTGASPHAPAARAGRGRVHARLRRLRDHVLRDRPGPRSPLDSRPRVALHSFRDLRAEGSAPADPVVGSEGSDLLPRKQAARARSPRPRARRRTSRPSSRSRALRRG